MFRKTEPLLGSDEENADSDNKQTRNKPSSQRSLLDRISSLGAFKYVQATPTPSPISNPSTPYVLLEDDISERKQDHQAAAYKPQILHPAVAKPSTVEQRLEKKAQKKLKKLHKKKIKEQMRHREPMTELFGVGDDAAYFAMPEEESSPTSCCCSFFSRKKPASVAERPLNHADFEKVDDKVFGCF
jgi:hypothetical protein